MALMSVHIHQRLRPTRYAFVVDQGDLNTILQATSLNAALWGGIYNPIIPLTPSENLIALVRGFDPDILVRLSSGDLPGDLAQRYEHRFLAPPDLVRTDEQGCYFALGFNLLPLLRHVHQTEVRFSVQPTRAALLDPEDHEGWREFIAIAFGSFQWLPEQSVDFGDAYTRALKARTVSLPCLTAPDRDLLLPLDFTRHGLQLFGGFGSCSSHIVCVGDHRSTADLVEFWNIRATGRTVVFVPVAASRAFEPWIRSVVSGGAYRINQHVDRRADIQKGPSLSEAQFEEVCLWIATLQLGQVAHRSWSPRFGMEVDGYVGDIHVADPEGAEREELSILDGSTMTPVKRKRPTPARVPAGLRA